MVCRSIFLPVSSPLLVMGQQGEDPPDSRCLGTIPKYAENALAFSNLCMSTTMDTTYAAVISPNPGTVMSSMNISSSANSFLMAFWQACMRVLKSRARVIRRLSVSSAISSSVFRLFTDAMSLLTWSRLMPRSSIDDLIWRRVSESISDSQA